MNFNKLTTLLVSEAPRLVTIRFNRVDKRNALNLAMVEELHAVVDFIASKRPETVTLFSGAGDQAFISGADIGELRQRDGATALQGINANICQKIWNLPFPTIAAIHGTCFGGGLEIALACDVRVASEGASFAQPEVGLGIIPGAGATYRLPALIGPGLAREMIFSGSKIDSARAREIGLVNRVVPRDELIREAETLAQAILAQDPTAVRMAKRIMNAETSFQPQELAILAQGHLFDSPAKRERMDQFLARVKK